MKRHCSVVIAAMTILLAACYSIPASAQALKIAVVDMDLVGDQYTDLVTQQNRLQTWIAQRKALMTSMSEFMFLSSSEFKEIQAIYEKPKNAWTDAEKKREAELRKISSDNEKRFMDLQAKQPRSAEEQNQFNTLRDTYQARDADLSALSQKYEAELKTQRAELQTKMVGNLRTVIESVGKAKGFSLVLDKTAVYYSAAPVEDITQDVLKALNANQPAAAAAPAAGGGNAGGH